jgi:hypothetical protein
MTSSNNTASVGTFAQQSAKTQGIATEYLSGNTTPDVTYLLAGPERKSAPIGVSWVHILPDEATLAAPAASSLLTFNMQESISADLVTDLYLIVHPTRPMLQQWLAETPLFTLLEFFIGEDQSQCIDSMLWEDFILRGTHRAPLGIHRYSESSGIVSTATGVFKIPLWFCQERTRDAFPLCRVQTKVYIRLTGTPSVATDAFGNTFPITFSILAETITLSEESKKQFMGEEVLQQLIRVGRHTSIRVTNNAVSTVPRYKLDFMSGQFNADGFRILELYIFDENEKITRTSVIPELSADFSVSGKSCMQTIGGSSSSSISSLSAAYRPPSAFYTIPGTLSHRTHTSIPNFPQSIYYSFADLPEMTASLDPYFQSVLPSQDFSQWSCTLEAPANIFIPQTLGVLFICYALLQYVGGSVVLRPVASYEKHEDEED